MVFQPIHPMSGLTAVVKKRLSDIEFLAKKEFDNKLVSAEGDKQAATGTLVSLTASAGKDLYLASAKVTFAITFGGTVGFEQLVELQYNGVPKETSQGTVFEASKAGYGTIVYEFKNIGQKVIATQVIRLQVIKLDTNVSVEGALQGFEEPTGGDPTI